jgi:phosphoribosylanthranilate isomerase
MLQCHGHELPVHLEALAPYPVLKVVTLTGEDDLARLADYAAWPLLVDTPTPHHGGSGRTGNWGLAARAARTHRVVLAGGLTPDNVAAAIATVRPWGVDVSSGVEQRPGRKDQARVRAFITAARHAAEAAGVTS